MTHPTSAGTPGLNPAQKDAVEHGDGPLLVLAGAGSGKTRVITHRIVRLIERGVPPAAICALTFTNKAAAEMRSRVDRMLAAQAKPQARRGGGREPTGALTVCTFHAFGLEVLSRERSALGGAFTIFDRGDQTALVKQLLREAGSDRAFDSEVVLARISTAKNALAPPEEFRVREGDEYDEIAREIYPRYRDALRRYRAFDFDDLVCEVVRLWRDRSDMRARWQERFLYVLVDEYQDTNRAQLEMLRLLCAVRKNVCAVGDDDQSIYGWRGAEVRNIVEFDRHFEGARVVKLEQNYRSTMPILAVANAAIAKRSDARWTKVLFTEATGGAPVRAVVAATAEVEAAWVAREIRRFVRDLGKQRRDIAVLYRSNNQASAVEEALREQGIAHRVVGGMQFFERKEVKDVLAYLKLALNQADEISLRRILNHPPRGIGELTLDRLLMNAYTRGWSLWQAIERVDALDDINTAARDGCRALTGVIARARADLLTGKQRPSDVARAIVEQVGLKAAIEAASGGSASAAAKRWANVEGVLGTLGRREAREGPGIDGLAAFLQFLTMDIAADSEDGGDLVTLSTLHGSKGLEFDVVFLVGCEEGYLPHARTIDPRVTDAVGDASSDIEEERRLFYVGVTRAREHLSLSRARARILRGKAIPRTPSRFLLDIPSELLETQEIDHEAPTTAREAAANAGAILAMLQSRGRRP